MPDEGEGKSERMAPQVPGPRGKEEPGPLHALENVPGEGEQMRGRRGWRSREASSQKDWTSPPVLQGQWQL